jgi:hypothetical protein
MIVLLTGSLPSAGFLQGVEGGGKKSISSKFSRISLLPACFLFCAAGYLEGVKQPRVIYLIDLKSN